MEANIQELNLTTQEQKWQGHCISFILIFVDRLILQPEMEINISSLSWTIICIIRWYGFTEI